MFSGMNGLEILNSWPRFESGEPVGFGDEVSRLGEVFSISLYCDGSFALNFRAYSKGERVRRPAKVPDADGVEIRVGETVWDTDDETDTPLTIVEVSSDLVRCEYTWKDGKTYKPCYQPDQLTHQRPDSWKRIEEDAMLSPHSYICACGKHDDAMPKSVQMSIDLVRRARALAERERGE